MLGQKMSPSILVSRLLTFLSFTLPGLVCSQRAPNYILASFGNWVTGTESGIRMAVTCRHQALQFPQHGLLLHGLANGETSLCKTTCNRVVREAIA